MKSLLSACVAAILVSGAQADVIIVNPGPGTPVQDAIDSAMTGDEVVLTAGAYPERIDLTGKAITVRSDAGAAATILDGQDAGPVVRFVTGETASTVLEGLTIRGGSGEPLGQFTLGGGVYIDGASPTVADCTITGNSATLGGGLAVNGPGAPLVRGCTFTANHADQGGGVYLHDASPGFLGCGFEADSAEFRGGSVFVDGQSAPQFVNVMFAGSTAEKLDGGAVAVLRDTAPSIVNGVFTGNSAGCAGGGVYAFHKSAPALSQDTFVGNTGGSGGGLAAESTVDATISNSVFAGPIGSGVAGTGLTVRYSCIQTGWSGAGTGNVSAPPRLVDPSGADGVLGTLDDDVRLAAGSPCIDAADGLAMPADALDVNGNGNVTEPIPVDFGGGPRVVDAVNYADTGVPAQSGAVPDMGAFEAPADIEAVCPCDVDGVAGVNVFDLIAYLNLWFNGSPAAEFTGDDPAVVNVFDLLAYLQCWFSASGGAPCP